MKKTKGYIFSRNFFEERVPQNIQNLAIRNYCKKKSYNYLLSSVEYTMKNSFLILNDLVRNMKSYEGITAYSLFQLPSNNKLRNDILNRIIKKKKFISFAVEDLKVSNFVEKEEIEKIHNLVNCEDPMEVWFNIMNKDKTREQLEKIISRLDVKKKRRRQVLSKGDLTKL